MTTIAAGGGGAEEAVWDNLRNPGGAPIGGALQSWKLYDNPIYHRHQPHHRRRREHTGFPAHRQYNHAGGRPISASRLAASFRDVSALFRPVETSASDAAAAAVAASSELHLARAHIRELKAELGIERRLREKAEAVNRALALQTSEERARSDRLAEEAARAKDEVQELRRAVDGERRRMRLADALREERLQMKLADARVLMEEKLPELRNSLRLAGGTAAPSTTGELCRGSSVEGGDGGRGGAAVRRKKKEAENPHIRRGIRGFVEFPRSGRTRAGGRSESRDGRADPGPKLECQMAQLRVLLKHRVGASGSVNLVM